MITLKRTLVCALILVANLMKIAGQTHGGSYTQLSGYPFVFISDDTVTVSPIIGDSLFDAAAQGIRFKVNRTELQPNDPFIDLYRNYLAPWLNLNQMQLRQVFVRGAASPEGPYENNVRLSRERTKRLIEFLNSELDIKLDERLVKAENIVEDYGLLVKMMGKAADADYERVRDLWLDCEGDEACCKDRLMALDGGKVWRRLLKEYFPSLRQARVVLWFVRRHVKPAEITMPTTSYYTPTIQPMVFETPMQYMRRHLIAVRTNLVHDLLYVPQFGFAYGGNIQLEYYPLNGHLTYNAGFTFTNHRHWGDQKFFQLRDAQLEVRRYFKGGGAFIGPFVGLYAEGTVYGIGFSKSKGWEGEGGGGGLSFGYTFPLTRKGNLRLELTASLGAFYTRYDPYVYGNPLVTTEDGLYYYDYLGNTSDFKKRNHQFFWFGPTNLGIQLTYDLIYRKKKLVSSSSLQKGGNR